MASILRTLRESDPALLPLVAQIWGVKTDDESTARLIELLNKAMLDPARAEIVWDALDERQRGALQTLISFGGKMPENKFERLFGEIRQMGANVLQREQPHVNPANVAEALFYRGLISRAFENADTGPRAILYIPDDLLKVLPKKTAYDDLDDEAESLDYDQEDSGLDVLTQVSNIRQADTSLVDDMTTLLAYLQIHNPLLNVELPPGTLADEDYAALRPHLLNPSRERLAFLVGLGIGADLVELEAGRAFPKRAEARRWLSGARFEQVRRLVEAWRESVRYVDLWHVPGLHVEIEAGTMPQYNPAAARSAVIDIMSHALPRAEWWSVEQFIELVREDEADFQRPNSDFDSWYIQNDGGEYLAGLESWDEVEGALLRHLMTAPLHWLGLLDLADEAARLTAYGRALLELDKWPAPNDTPDKIDIGLDGTIVVSRKVARIDRFQVARFTSWGATTDTPSGKAFVYRLDSRGLKQAAEQGIHTGHIAAFINRALGQDDKAKLPPSIAKLLDAWKSGPAAVVTLERVLIVRTTAPETMDQIFEAPETRRFLGSRLGPMAAVVRAGQWEALRDALAEEGIEAQMVGE